MNSTQGEFTTYHPERPLYYRDYEQSRKVHICLHIGQRPLHFGLTSDAEKVAYYAAPVRYMLTLRYRMS